MQTHLQICHYSRSFLPVHFVPLGCNQMESLLTYTVDCDQVIRGLYHGFNVSNFLKPRENPVRDTEILQIDLFGL